MSNSTGLQLRPAVPSDFEFILSRAIGISKSNPLSKPNNVVALVSSGHCFTMTEHNIPIALGGVIPLWPKVAEVFSILTPSAGRRPLTVVKTIRAVLSQITENGNSFHRLQLHVRDEPHLRKWAELLGFTFEGQMAKFDSEGNTHLRYSMIWD